jgi:iron complex outermembrane receptor protein
VLYLLDISDMLVPYQIQNSASEEVFFRNAGKARNRGLEAKLQWVPVQGLRVSLAYTFMNFGFEDFLIESSSENTGLAQLAGNKFRRAAASLFAGMMYEHGSGVYTEIN